MAGRIRRDMRLIDAADGEAFHDALVRTLHGGRIGGIERAFVLIHKHACIGQRIIAVSVELRCEKSLARSERVGRIHYYKVVFALLASYKTKSVGKMYIKSGVVHRNGHFGEIFLADLNDLFIYLDKVDMLYRAVTAQLPYRTAVACADNKHVLYILLYRHRNVNYHIVIDKFVFLRYHYISVKRKQSAEFERLKHVYALILALLAVKLLVNSYRKSYTVAVIFSKPKIHLYYRPFNL